MACANLEAYGSSCFLVTGLLEGGVAEAWNCSCHEAGEPWRRLHVAAAILSVNGICGDVKRMQQELETETDVSLTFCNPPNVFCMRSVLLAVQTGAAIPLQCLFWREASNSLHAEVMRQQASQARAGCGAISPDSGGLALSVVITTSPIPSNPSTEMLERVLASPLALVL